MNRLPHLIFDLDGTLIDSSAGVADAVNYSLRMCGHAERDPLEIAKHIGYPLRQMYADFGVGPFETLYRHFQDRAVTSVIDAAQPLDHADSVVSELVLEGYEMAIATTKVRRHVDQIVAKLGWTAHFSALIGGDEVSHPKPDPEAFVLALRRLCAKPFDSIVVGDTINDVLAARALSIPVVAIISPYGGEETLRASRPDYVIDSIALLPDLLRELQSRKDSA